MNLEAKEIIGLDLGAVRTGIARASTLARIPEPLLTVETDKAIETVKGITAEKDLEAIVIGLPRNLKGEDTDQTRWVRKWVEGAKKDFSVPFFWQDEALTSQVAEDRTGKNKLSGIDAEAAAIILQDFLDTPEPERVLC